VSVDDSSGSSTRLQNDQDRAKLVADLRALIAAQRGATPEKPAAVTFLGRLSQQIDALTGEILAGVAVIVDAPRLLGWAREQIFDPASRARWLEAAYAAVLVFGIALVGEWVLRWLLAS